MRSFALAGLLALSALCGCSSLPTLEGRTVSTVLRHTADTTLGKAVRLRTVAHPGDSGILTLRDPHDAFAARMLLARAAERSLDVQSYIWRADLTGTLLFEALRAAAGRGVRVRLLLDDNNTVGLDETLAMLAAQQNMEVRLFNPFAVRSPRWFGFATDFQRLNRRMHNKSFTADNQATIVGGRNIGDEYFDATHGVLFSDLDVMAIGPIVEAVSEDFDRYWASASSYPVARLLPPAPPSAAAEFDATAAAVERAPAALAYTTALRKSPFVERLVSGELELDWAPTRLVSDDPDKGLGLERPDERVFADLKDVIGDARHDLEIVSPYFVPNRRGVDALTALARRGVDVRVLTNSLEATDVAAVHAGYAGWRKPLLEGGVRLFELRRIVSTDKDTRIAGLADPKAGSGFGGSSSSSLHAKAFATDHARVFVGSFNFDPRSIRLNTELGFVIESPALATELAEVFEREVPERAYEVRLSESGELMWIERHDGQVLVFHHEPGTSALKRAWTRVLSYLPIDWLL